MIPSENGRAGPADDETGHYSGEGRNIAPGGRSQGHDGNDIFFAAVQMSRMPMILSDPQQHDNPIVFCNSAFERLVGYSNQEIIGRNCRFLQGEHTDPDAVQRIRESISTSEDVHEELLNYRKDGTPFWNALFISPVYDAQGELIYYFASQLDVTRRREAEEVLRQSQRMETLGSMASGVAHEFNNLMMITLGNVQQVLARTQDERSRKQLQAAEWGARQACRLTQQILSFARRQFHDNQLVDLNDVVTGFDSMLGQIAGKEHPILVQADPRPAQASVDAGQLELALLNLVRNAADAMPGGGEIRIHVDAAPDLSDEIVPGNAVEIVVADGGQGMTADVLRRATEPFYTTKERGKGTGLGLSMVQGFMAQCGGALKIESMPGIGTSMRLRFPRHVEGEPLVIPPVVGLQHRTEKS